MSELIVGWISLFLKPDACCSCSLVALSPTFTVFVIARSIIGFALNGEWSLGSMLVAETWPARLRGRVISIHRAAWCFGASLAGAITGIAAANWGWRTAVMVPGVIALLAILIDQLLKVVDRE